jgi:hypothetical protein
MKFYFIDWTSIYCVTMFVGYANAHLAISKIFRRY